MLCDGSCKLVRPGDYCSLRFHRMNYPTRSGLTAPMTPRPVTEAKAHRHATAIIPTRKNAKPRAESRAGARARNEILRATRELGRSIWKKWSGYDRRSLVETKMGCFKRLGERVMARDFERQVTELKIRASILNRFTQLGTAETVRVA
jgi:hypothetical protein